jgi:hypothetical protein
MVKYLVLVLMTAILTGLLHTHLLDLKYEIYKETLGALLNVSSIIFAIIGAWIAIIYPRAMGRVFSSKVSVNASEVKEADGDASYLAELVEIVMISASVLMAVLLIQFGTPILKEIFRFYCWISYGKLALFYAVALLMFVQLDAVCRVILVNYYFLSQLRDTNANSKVDILHK